jgi:hypothetical protein
MIQLKNRLSDVCSDYLGGVKLVNIKIITKLVDKSTNSDILCLMNIMFNGHNHETEVFKS